MNGEHEGLELESEVDEEPIKEAEAEKEVVLSSEHHEEEPMPENEEMKADEESA
jgi:hypothetical protein